MKVTASKLQKNIYGILNEVLETGLRVEVVRKGKILKIVPEVKPGKLSLLKQRPNCIIGDPEDFGNMDWLQVE
jgi:hypothetical protein